MGGRSIIFPEERRQAPLNSLRRGKEINEPSEEETAWIRGRRLEETWAWNDGSMWADIANLFGGSLDFESFSVLLIILTRISEIDLV